MPFAPSSPVIQSQSSSSRPSASSSAAAPRGHRVPDRQRLLEVERLADAVLHEQDKVRNADRRRNQTREAQGVFRRKEIKGEKECWMMMNCGGPHQQFISMPLASAKKKMDVEAVGAQVGEDFFRRMLKKHMS